MNGSLITQETTANFVFYTDTFKPIPSCPGYYAGADGSIIGIRGNVLKPWKTNGGYHKIGLWLNGARRHKYVSHLVAEAFLGERPKGFQIDHINRIRTDNRLENLRYVTPSENCKNRRKRNGKSQL